MQILKSKQLKKAQAAIEYMLLLGVLTIVALVGFKEFVPNTKENSELFFNKTAERVMGALAGARVRKESSYP